MNSSLLCSLNTSLCLKDIFGVWQTSVKWLLAVHQKQSRLPLAGKKVNKSLENFIKIFMFMWTHEMKRWAPWMSFDLGWLYRFSCFIFWCVCINSSAAMNQEPLGCLWCIYRIVPKSTCHLWELGYCYLTEKGGERDPCIKQKSRKSCNRNRYWLPSVSLPW